MAQTGGLSICLMVSRSRETPSDNGRDPSFAWPRSRQSQLADRRHSATRLSLRSLFASGAVIPALFAAMTSIPARASCTITTSSATCDGAAAPSTYTGPVIGSGAATANGFTVNLINNAQINISTPNVNQNDKPWQRSDDKPRSQHPCAEQRSNRRRSVRDGQRHNRSGQQ